MQTDTIANEGFWTRVRTALTRRADEPAYGQAAISANIGKKRRTTQVVDDELRICWASAATRNVSLCVINVEMDRFAEYYAVYGQDAADDCVARLGDIVSNLRPRETIQCLRSGRCGFTLILPDMPVLVARALVGKLMAAVKAEGLINKESHTGLVTMGAGPPDSRHGQYGAAPGATAWPRPAGSDRSAINRRSPPQGCLTVSAIA